MFGVYRYSLCVAFQSEIWQHKSYCSVLILTHIHDNLKQLHCITLDEFNYSLPVNRLVINSWLNRVLPLAVTSIDEVEEIYKTSFRLNLSEMYASKTSWRVDT